MKFTCLKCQKNFEPDPEMVIEAGLIDPEDYQKFHEEGQQWKNQDAPVSESAIFLCETCLSETISEGTNDEN